MTEGWDPYLLALYRGGIGFLFALVWFLFSRRPSGLGSWRLWVWSIIAGLGVAGNFIFYFVSIDQGSVAVAATLMYSAPIFVFLVSFLLGIESPTPVKIISIFFVALGVVLLTRVYAIGAGGAGQILSGLLSGVSYGLFIFAFQYATYYGSPPAILSIAFATLVLILIAFVDAGEVVAVLRSPRWPLFVALGVFGAGLSFMLYILGIGYVAPAIAAVVAMVEPVTASLFGVAVLHETLTEVQMLGMALILFTVTAVSIHTSSR